jgi:hypothetical protein
MSNSSVSTPLDLPAAGPVSVPLALSPSRVADFKTCPLLYRFRAIDRLPEPPSAEAVRGTLVHSVLERLFDAPAAARTPDHARGLAAAGLAEMMAEQPELVRLVGETDEPVHRDHGSLGLGQVHAHALHGRPGLRLRRQGLHR